MKNKYFHKFINEIIRINFANGGLSHFIVKKRKYPTYSDENFMNFKRLNLIKVVYKILDYQYNIIV